MERIFGSMAVSDRPEHTDEFKRQMLRKMLANSSATISAPEVSSLLSLFVEWSLVSDSRMLNLTGFRLAFVKCCGRSVNQRLFALCTERGIWSVARFIR